jgi:hypothetical protein
VSDASPAPAGPPPGHPGPHGTVETLVSFFGDRRAPQQPPPSEPQLSQDQSAFVALACKRTGVVWLRHFGVGRPQPAWFAWDGTALLLVQGPGEQPHLDVLEGLVEVVVPAKESRARLAVFLARADLLSPGSPEWDEAARALAAIRLNATDPAEQTQRWARHCRVVRLLPLALLAGGAGTAAEPAQADVPAASPHRSQVRRPWHLGSRRGRAARLAAWAGGES